MVGIPEHQSCFWAGLGSSMGSSPQGHSMCRPATCSLCSCSVSLSKGSSQPNGLKSAAFSFSTSRVLDCPGVDAMEPLPCQLSLRHEAEAWPKVAEMWFNLSHPRHKLHEQRPYSQSHAWSLVVEPGNQLQQLPLEPRCPSPSSSCLRQSSQTKLRERAFHPNPVVLNWG